MYRLGSRVPVIALAIAALLVSAAPSAVRAQTAPDRSEVVLVLDFSASILEDPANRNRFGAALERIAARVQETSDELAAGDTTVSIVQFAAKAADYGRCSELKLLNSPAAVSQFAGCLRSVAAAYRKGLDASLRRRIGVDTNYVAAMNQAARHLPADAVRPAMILFTDGRHDVKGVPTSQVRVVRDQLFGSRSPFALLPVGMGLDPKKRDALESGLAGLRIVKDMPPCVTGTTFDWPRVVFQSADEAGNAVAVALQDATCTFTVEEAPPAPVLRVGAVQGIKLLGRDRAIDLTWTAPPSSATSAPVIDYRARCRTGAGDWIESKEGASTEPKATVEGLTNGAPYQCEVVAVGSASEGAWTAAPAAAMPLGRPAAPGKPSVTAFDRSLQIAVTPASDAAVSEYRFECSADGGSTWTARTEAAASSGTAQLNGVTNGAQYVCRAFAANATGLSDPSALSDAVMPCGSAFECNPLLQPLLIVLGVVVAAGLLIAFFAIYRERSRRGYVVAVVDVVHSANLGHGSRVGIAFVRDPATKRVIDVVPDRSRKADVRIHHLGGERFSVVDMAGRRIARAGEPVVAVDAAGGRHQLILHAFGTIAATEMAGRG